MEPEFGDSSAVSAYWAAGGPDPAAILEGAARDFEALLAEAGPAAGAAALEARREGPHARSKPLHAKAITTASTGYARMGRLSEHDWAPREAELGALREATAAAQKEAAALREAEAAARREVAALREAEAAARREAASLRGAAAAELGALREAAAAELGALKATAAAELGALSEGVEERIEALQVVAGGWGGAPAPEAGKGTAEGFARLEGAVEESTAAVRALKAAFAAGQTPLQARVAGMEEALKAQGEQFELLKNFVGTLIRTFTASRTDELRAELEKEWKAALAAAVARAEEGGPASGGGAGEGGPSLPEPGSLLALAGPLEGAVGPRGWRN